MKVSHLIGVHSNTGTYEGHSGVKIVPTKVMFDFACEPIRGELATSNETSDSRWISKEEVLDMVLAPAQRLRYQAYLDENGSIHYTDYITRPQFELKVKRNL